MLNPACTVDRCSFINGFVNISESCRKIQKIATLHDGTIAGSATNLMDCVRFVVKKVGLPFETAVMCASENPAKEIGIFHEVGSISAGKKADFVLLDKDLNIVSVYVDGKEITC